MERPGFKRSGKRAYMATLVRARIAAGLTVVVVTPDGDVDGAEWLRRHAESS